MRTLHCFRVLLSATFCWATPAAQTPAADEVLQEAVEALRSHVKTHNRRLTHDPGPGNQWSDYWDPDAIRVLWGPVVNVPHSHLHRNSLAESGPVTIHGRVVDESGALIPGARVLCLSSIDRERADWSGALKTYSDYSGLFQCRLDDANFVHVTAQLTGFKRTSISFEPFENPATVLVQLEIGAAHEEIEQPHRKSLVSSPEAVTIVGLEREGGLVPYWVLRTDSQSRILMRDVSDRALPFRDELEWIAALTRVTPFYRDSLNLSGGTKRLGIYFEKLARRLRKSNFVEPNLRELSVREGSEALALNVEFALAHNWLSLEGLSKTELGFELEPETASEWLDIGTAIVRTHRERLEDLGAFDSDHQDAVSSFLEALMGRPMALKVYESLGPGLPKRAFLAVPVGMAMIYFDWESSGLSIEGIVIFD